MKRLQPPGRPDITTRFNHYQPCPGHPDWRELQADARRLAAQIQSMVEARKSAWLDGDRHFRGYATLLRNYVANRRRARVGRQDFLPLYFVWTIQRTCNFRCRYCDDHFGRKHPDLSNEGMLDTDQSIRLLKIMRTGVPSVLFSGGEPTLRDDFPEITRAARNLAYFPIIVNTNGSLLHQLLQKTRWRTWLADCDHIVVSLDALDPKVLSEMWCYQSPEVVIRNILLLHELSRGMRFKLLVSTVIQPGLTDHARDVLNLTNDLGICFCPMPMNVGPAIEASLLNDSQYQDLVKLILARKRAGYRIAGSLRLNERMLTAQPLQCRNTLKPHIDFDGRIFWPCKASMAIEPLMIRALDFENLDAIYEHASNLLDPTDFQLKCGARCNWSQHYTTDAYAHFLTNPWTIFSEIRDFLRAK